MEEKRVLRINPDLFSMKNNTTRKTQRKNDAEKEKRIKMKTHETPKKMDSLKKKSILKMIRQQQEDHYKKMFSANNAKPKSQPLPPNAADKFNQEFQEAQLFLENLTKKTDETSKMKNYTLRNYAPNTTTTPNQMFYGNSDNFENISQNIPMPPRSIPQYGCLKGGSLPTYRNYVSQKTQKIMPTLGGGAKMPQPMPQPPMRQEPAPRPPPPAPSAFEKEMDEKIRTSSEITQMQTKAREPISQIPQTPRQKRIHRRTYKVGKSKVAPKIAVLVSNKTIRNNITTKKQLLKQDSIQNIKRFLVKRGLIKVGSIAPNDVLRKMYESATMMCGDVQNHNPDTLLYNFVNDKEL
jgi:hypothetical protein